MRSSIAERVKQRLKPVVLRHSGFIGSTRSIAATEPKVIMTFDDGPDPVGTEQVLAALAKHNARATFFVLMTRVRRYPKLLAEIIDHGHEVALHGPDHQPISLLRYRDVLRRTVAAREELEQIIGRPVRWFRPPYGRQTLASWLAVRRAGLEPVVWTTEVWDWRDVSRAERIARSQVRIGRGAIVLAHDACAGPEDGAEAAAAVTLDRGDLINQVLAGYRELGLGATSVGDQFDRGAELVRGAWFH